jgi:SAM-dependent methyltransferase
LTAVALPFALPPVVAGGPVPRWTGAAFDDGARTVSVLEYGENLDGWNDDLTDLHERAAGDAHPIDLASRQDALAQVRTYVPSSSATILEVGCSSGYLLHDLRRTFPEATLLGADVVSGPLQRLARELPEVPLFRFDLVTCPLPSESIDAVVMLNVLEHIADDAGALRQVRRILKPGGVVVIEVPAGPHLFDDYDRVLKHFRRYRMRDLQRVLEQADLKVVRRSHLGALLYPMFVWSKRRSQGTERSADELERYVSQQVSRTASSRVMELCLGLEKRLGHWVSYPIGIRCLAVARRMS